MEKSLSGQFFANIVDSDFSELEGTNCYCSEESRTAIRRGIAELPLHSIHKIGNGDYHYVSLFWLERIEEPFVLILFDNHPDDQPDAFGGDMLSCGSWVMEARKLPCCKSTIWYDGKGEMHLSGEGGDCRNAYLSIDPDILSPEYARTNWDQGEMTLEELKRHISEVMERFRIIGVDICTSPDDLTKNVKTEEAIINLLVGK
ncbi:MAG: hypothetical protein MJY89_03575 [Bacteroidales bacterium]|nr:hypothetical protein [Bacteroidales bacterium]